MTLRDIWYRYKTYGMLIQIIEAKTMLVIARDSGMYGLGHRFFMRRSAALQIDNNELMTGFYCCVVILLPNRGRVPRTLQFREVGLCFYLFYLAVFHLFRLCCRGKACAGTRVLIIGAGPCGLR
jgi:hypothetical protein